MNITNIKQHLLGSFFALAIVGALLTLPSAQAAGSPPNQQTAHGSWTDCEHVTNVTDYGSYLVVDIELTTTFTGTFEGTLEVIEQDVFYPDGYVTVHLEGTFTGSVAGRGGGESDTVRMSNYEAFSLGGFPHRRGAVWMVDKGTGDLAGLRGEGSRTVFPTDPAPGCESTFFGTYEATISFGP